MRPTTPDKDGSQNWGDTFTSDLTAAAPGTVTGDFRELVRVHDVAQLWGLRLSLTWLTAIAAGSAAADFEISSGVGRATFLLLRGILVAAPVAVGQEQSVFIPDFPAQTISIRGRGAWVAAGAGSVSFRVSAAACPYYPGARR
jgi:hypothetical protein